MVSALGRAGRRGGSPHHDPAEAVILRERCLAYWRRVDEVVGELENDLPEVFALHAVLTQPVREADLEPILTGGAASTNP